jgi:hypothetical protein
LLLARRGKGRPKKCSGGTISRPTYRELGITKPHIARDALAVAQAVSEPMLCRFLTTEPNLRVAALLRFARHHEGTTEGCWLLPPEWQDGLRARYGEYVDLFPYPRKEGYDALTISWAEVQAQHPGAALLVHPPFIAGDYDEGQSLVDVVRKCIAEASLGVGPILLVMPTRYAVNLLLEAKIQISKMRSMGRPRFGHTSRPESHKSPPPVTFFELNPPPAGDELTMSIPVSMLETEIIDGEECWRIPMPTGLRENTKYRVKICANGREIPDDLLVWLPASTSIPPQ